MNSADKSIKKKTRNFRVFFFIVRSIPAPDIHRFSYNSELFLRRHYYLDEVILGEDFVEDCLDVL